VKSEKRGDLLDNLKETFDNLRKSKMMLNPKKCVFGVSSGKLLGYMVSSQGINANPKKMEAIENVERVQWSPDWRTHVVCAWKLIQGISSSDDRCPKERWS
jgi:hypothetical protein